MVFAALEGIGLDPKYMIFIERFLISLIFGA
jgi:hypothetical protein